MVLGSTPGARFAAPHLSLALALLAVAAAPVQGWAQISAHPVVVTLEAARDTGGATVMVANHGGAPLQFRVYAGDFDQAADGTNQFAAAGTHPSSCAGRLHLIPAELVIDANQSRPVAVRMAPGPETCWSIVWIEALAMAGGGIRVAQRIGVKTHAVGSAAPPLLRIEAVRVERTVPDCAIVVVLVENPGERPLRPEGRVEIRTFEGEVAATVPVPSFSILPDHRRELRIAIALDGLAADRYLAVPILDYGGATILAAQREFDVER